MPRGSVCGTLVPATRAPTSPFPRQFQGYTTFGSYRDDTERYSSPFPSRDPRKGWLNDILSLVTEIVTLTIGQPLRTIVILADMAPDGSHPDTYDCKANVHLSRPATS